MFKRMVDILVDDCESLTIFKHDVPKLIKALQASYDTQLKDEK